MSERRERKYKRWEFVARDSIILDNLKLNNSHLLASTYKIFERVGRDSRGVSTALQAKEHELVRFRKQAKI